MCHLLFFILSGPTDHNSRSTDTSNRTRTNRQPPNLILPWDLVAIYRLASPFAGPKEEA